MATRDGRYRLAVLGDCLVQVSERACPPGPTLQRTPQIRHSYGAVGMIAGSGRYRLAAEAYRLVQIG
jgi:hypothetical protein